MKRILRDQDRGAARESAGRPGLPRMGPPWVAENRDPFGWLQPLEEGSLSLGHTQIYAEVECVARRPQASGPSGHVVTEF